METEEFVTDDEMERLNRLIPSYKSKNGQAQITCHMAISLINRYCANLEQNVCGTLYPIYHIMEHRLDNIINMYACSLRLPPNSTVTDTIESGLFKRKKYAKMDAALKMCAELDKAGELAENLTILTRKDWLLAHYDLKEDEKENSESKQKIGSTKSKKEYEIAVSDEFKDNYPLPNNETFLYQILIQDSTQNETASDSYFDPMSIKLGFLSGKNISDKLSEFKLYKDNREFSVSINRVGNIIFNNGEHELLKRFHSAVFSDLLGINYLDNFEDSINGGFVVLLDENRNINWDYLKSVPSDKTVFDLIQSDQLELNDKLVKRLNSNNLMIIRNVKLNETPLTEFPNKELASNFKEYFMQKYSLETKADNQPLVQIEFFSNNSNFILKQNTSEKKHKKSKYELLFIGEHLRVLNFDAKMTYVLSFLPSIFYRVDCLLKARKLMHEIETGILNSLEIARELLVNEKASKWDESIEFHRRIQTDTINDDYFSNADLVEPEDDSIINSEMDVEEDSNRNQLCLIYLNNDDTNKELSLSMNDSDSKPSRLIINDSTDQECFKLPNEYQILQCLTLKTANDCFDLERYEVLGDCFLKLTVVLKIYVDFFKTNEGKMVALKSIRVSNRYLYKLAHKKSLQSYIVSQTFMPKVNWIGPYTNRETLASLKQRNKLSDKSLADCVEALIGVYLLNSGTHAARALIEWLDFVISDQNGRTKFSSKYEFPDPVFNKNVDMREVSAKFKELSDFEKNVLDYEFKNKFYLYQALTHSSDTTNYYTSSYQKLELVGDAVLDFLITQHIFADRKEYSPGDLTVLRQALVNNKFFSHLAVKFNFHKYFSYKSQSVFRELFDYIQVHNEHSPDIAYLGCLNKANEEIEGFDDFEIEAPKFLADIFESVAGAIYLDSAGSLETVWKVYFRFLRPYLIAFKKNTPKSPIDELHKLKPEKKFKIEYKNKIDDNQDDSSCFEAILIIGDQENEKYAGSGTTRKAAKKSAFKKAIRALSPNKNVIFF